MSRFQVVDPLNGISCIWIKMATYILLPKAEEKRSHKHSRGALSPDKGALHHQSKSVKERDNVTGIWIKRHPLLPHLELHLLN